jgi:hypothetical protein
MDLAMERGSGIGDGTEESRFGGRAVGVEGRFCDGTACANAEGS